MRSALIMLACLAVGAAVSLAVAATLGRGGAVDFEVREGGLDPAVAAAWARHRGDGWPAAPGLGRVERGAGTIRVVAMHHEPGGRLHAAWELTAGWPAGCLRRAARITSPPPQRAVAPARLLATGLALDAAFYGAGLLLLLRACYGVRVRGSKEHADGDDRLVAVPGAAGGRTG